MDGAPQTTFMPRKPVSDAVQTRATGGNTFLSISSIILAIVLMISAGIFAYNTFYLQKSLASYQANLASTARQFDPSSLSDMTTFSNQLAAAQTVLNQHLALSTFFNSLAANTVVPVQFTSFSYTDVGNTITIDLKGQAASFAALNAEENQLQQQGSILQNPTIGSVSVSKTGVVNFAVSGTLSPSDISYLAGIGSSTAPTQ